MHARVLRKWSLHTKPLMYITMWRLLLFTILLLRLCVSPATCISNTVNRSTAFASATVPVISSASAAVHASAPAAALTMTAMKHTIATPASTTQQSSSQQLSLAPATPETTTAGEDIEESFYIPVDGGDGDKNIYDSRLVQALHVNKASSGINVSDLGHNISNLRDIANSWRSSNSYGSNAGSRIFNSSVVSSSSSRGAGERQQLNQQESKAASTLYADNKAYAYYRSAAKQATVDSRQLLSKPHAESRATLTPAIAAAVLHPHFSVHGIVNDDNIANDDDTELIDEDDGDDDAEEEAEGYGLTGDVGEHAIYEDDVSDRQQHKQHQQHKVPNNMNSHIINLLNTYKRNNHNNNCTSNQINPNLQTQLQQQYHLENTHAVTASAQREETTASSVALKEHNSGRRTFKTRRHVSTEERRRWLTRQQHQQERHRFSNSIQSSPTSIPLPIAAYPTKKVFQLVNGKNLTRIVHLFPPTRYHIAAYEIPSSLPYRGELTEQQRRMLQHQHEQQLQQDQAARSRRDSRIFGLAQSLNGGAGSAFHGLEQSPQSVIGQGLAEQQQFQRLERSKSAGGSNWQQMSDDMFQRQSYSTQQQRQQYQKYHQHYHKQYQNNNEQPDVGGHRNTHSHIHPNNKHNHRQRQRKRPRRYCSARDPAQLAFEAPIVFEGKITSMSPDRRHNFAATVQVLNAYKQQIGFQVKREQFVRLQFAYINSSGECDIYREQLRPRGLVRDDELDLQRTYIFFVQQIDLRNFTILGQPIRKTRRVVEAVKDAVSENYARISTNYNHKPDDGNR
ncbi:protein vein isoform X2 [Ceratitis capitata]|uniref:protein vein isoform X2 n=1 Tax=Ceratitis capitata TaxID=7213 RepID=UPI000A0F9D73|nr:protein vein isoform X2 [Ceratitis capitata]